MVVLFCAIRKWWFQSICSFTLLSLHICVAEEHYNLTYPGVDLSFADYGMTVVLLVAYLLFVVILVLNMLIAVLGKSFADTLQTSMKVCRNG